MLINRMMSDLSPYKNFFNVPLAVGNNCLLVKVVDDHKIIGYSYNNTLYWLLQLRIATYKSY